VVVVVAVAVVSTLVQDQDQGQDQDQALTLIPMTQTPRPVQSAMGPGLSFQGSRRWLTESFLKTTPPPRPLPSAWWLRTRLIRTSTGVPCNSPQSASATTTS
jgi:hypothetical protein